MKLNKIKATILACVLVFNIIAQPIHAFASSFNSSGNAITEGNIEVIPEKPVPYYDVSNGNARIDGIIIGKEGYLYPGFQTDIAKYTITVLDNQKSIDVTVNASNRDRITKMYLFDKTTNSKAGPDIEFKKTSDNLAIAKIPPIKNSVETYVVETLLGAQGTAFYTLDCVLAPFKINLIASLSNTEIAGAKQLILSVELPIGTELSVLSMALKFDPQKLQLANRVTNISLWENGSVSKKNETIQQVAKDKRDQFVFDETALNGKNEAGIGVFNSAINKFGEMYMQIGIEDTATLSHKLTKTTIFNLHFRVIDENFDKNTIKLDKNFKSGNQSATNAANVSYSLGPNTGLISLQHPEMYTLSGINTINNIAIEEPIGGVIEVSDNIKQGDTIFLGQEITYTAKPNRGYAFVQWVQDTEIEALLKNHDVNWYKKPSFTIKIPNNTESIGAYVAIDSRGDGTTENSFKRILEPYDDKVGKLDISNAHIGEAAIISSTEYSTETGYFDGILTKNVNNAKNSNIIENFESKSENIIDLGTVIDSENNNIENSEFKLSVSKNNIGVKQIYKKYTDKTSGKFEEGLFTLVSRGKNTEIWIDDSRISKFTDEDIKKLQEEFDNNYKIITTKFGTIHDKDRNGKLSILMYDVDSVNPKGVAGMFNLNELIGNGIGNTGDFIHLDTEFDIKTIASTMIHETQHLSFASVIRGDLVSGNYITEEKYNLMIPKWIDEGLSQIAEHMAYGKLENRINTFNTDPRIARGETSLTEWKGSEDNYALSYIFLGYLISQNENIISDLYIPYGDKSLYKLDTQQIQSQKTEILKTNEKNFLKAVGATTSFKGMSFFKLHEAFRIATYMNDTTGVYGFGKGLDLDKEFAEVMHPVYPNYDFTKQRHTVSPASAYILPTSKIESMNINYPYIEPANLEITGIRNVPRKLNTKIVQPNGSTGVIKVLPLKQEYSRTEHVTLKAEFSTDLGEQPDFEFGHWSGGGSDVIDNTSLETKVLMNTNKTITANFISIDYRIVSLEQPENGKATLTDLNDMPLKPKGVRSGTAVKLSATPDTDFFLKEWIIERDGMPIEIIKNGETEIVVSNIKTDTLITPIFDDILYSRISYEVVDDEKKLIELDNASIDAKVLGEIVGNVMRNNPYKVLPDTELLIMPEIKSGYKFLRWEIGGKQNENQKVNFVVNRTRKPTVIRLVLEKAPLVTIPKPTNYFNIIPGLGEENPREDIIYDNVSGWNIKEIEQTHTITYDAKNTNDEGLVFDKWYILKNDVALTETQILEEMKSANVIFADYTLNMLIDRLQQTKITLPAWPTKEDFDKPENTFENFYQVESSYTKSNTIDTISRPFLFDISIPQFSNRELAKIQAGRIISANDIPNTSPLGFESSHGEYNLYVTDTDTEDFSLKIKRSYTFKNVNVYLNSMDTTPIMITDIEDEPDIHDSDNLTGILIPRNTNTIFIKVVSADCIEENCTDETHFTDYKINIVYIPEEKLPNVTLNPIQIGERTENGMIYKKYRLSVEVRNSAIINSQFTLNIPVGTKFYNANDINLEVTPEAFIPPKNGALNIIDATQHINNYRVSNAQYKIGKIDITFEKSLGEVRPEFVVDNEKSMDIILEVPMRDYEKFSNVVSLNRDITDNNIVTDFRLSGSYVKIIPSMVPVSITVSSVNSQNMPWAYLRNKDTNEILFTSKTSRATIEEDVYNDDTDIEDRFITDLIFDYVPEGEYVLEIYKSQHLSVIKQNLKVSEKEIFSFNKISPVESMDLDTGLIARDAVRKGILYLPAGDIDNDGSITNTDANLVKSRGYYGKTIEMIEEEFGRNSQEYISAIMLDINGDRSIDIRDYNLVRSSHGYGKRTIIIK